MAEPEQDLVAMADQNEAAQKDIARAHAAYYEALVGRNIPPDAAKEMAAAYIAAIHRPRGLFG